MQQIALDEIALANAQIAQEAAEAIASYMRSLPDDAWGGSSACAKWTVRAVSNHITGLYLIYAALAREVVEPTGTHDPGLEAMRSLHDGQMEQKIDAYVRRHGLEALPPDGLADAILRGASDFHAAIRRASVEQLQQIVTIPFGPFPLFVIADALAKEGVVHHWDMRAKRESGATIPATWAVPCAGSLASWVPYLAKRQGASTAGGAYLLQVDDGVGPVTVMARDGDVTAEASAAPSPDVVLHLSPDQYLRLATGRLDIAQEAAAGAPTIEGDPARAAQLNQIFQGI